MNKPSKPKTRQEPRNSVVRNPLLKKSHAHKSNQDYDRASAKRNLRRELNNQ